MKKLLLSVIAIGSFVYGNTQNFVITPEPHRVDTVIMENYEAYDINFTTAVPEAITFNWILLSNTLLSSWTYSICYQGGCAVGIPTSTVSMEPITLTQAQQGVQGFLKINLTTGLNYGHGKAVFYVYDATDINRGDTVSFDIYWPDPLSVTEVSFSDQFEVFPNPANENLIVSSEFNASSHISLINAIGESVFSESISANETKQIDVSEFPKGVYFLAINSDKNQMVRKVILN